MWRLIARDLEGREVARAMLGERSTEVTIGRDPKSSLLLTAPDVSRRHARVILQHGQPVIRDEGSSGGVMVDGERVVIPTVLKAGSSVHIAGYLIEVQAA